MTPAQLRALAREGRARAAKLRATADALEKQAGELERLAGDAENILRTVDTERTIRVMDVNTESESVRRAAGRATRNHPAQKKLYDAGVTITELAALLKEGRPRVSSWFAEGDANRPIPKRHAERLKDKYGIPLSAWARVGS